MATLKQPTAIYSNTSILRYYALLCNKMIYAVIRSDYFGYVWHYFKGNSETGKGNKRKHGYKLQKVAS